MRITDTFINRNIMIENPLQAINRNSGIIDKMTSFSIVEDIDKSNEICDCEIALHVKTTPATLLSTATAEITPTITATLTTPTTTATTLATETTLATTTPATVAIIPAAATSTRLATTPAIPTTLPRTTMKSISRSSTTNITLSPTVSNGYQQGLATCLLLESQNKNNNYDHEDEIIFNEGNKDKLIFNDHLTSNNYGLISEAVHCNECLATLPSASLASSSSSITSLLTSPEANQVQIQQQQEQYYQRRGDNIKEEESVSLYQVIRCVSSNHWSCSCSCLCNKPTDSHAKEFHEQQQQQHQPVFEERFLNEWQEADWVSSSDHCYHNKVGHNRPEIPRLVTEKVFEKQQQQQPHLQRVVEEEKVTSTEKCYQEIKIALREELDIQTIADKANYNKKSQNNDVITPDKQIIADVVSIANGKLNTEHNDFISDIDINNNCSTENNAFEENKKSIDNINNSYNIYSNVLNHSSSNNNNTYNRSSTTNYSVNYTKSASSSNSGISEIDYSTNNADSNSNINYTAAPSSIDNYFNRSLNDFSMYISDTISSDRNESSTSHWKGESYFNESDSNLLNHTYRNDNNNNNNNNNRNSTGIKILKSLWLHGDAVDEVCILGSNEYDNDNTC